MRCSGLTRQVYVFLLLRSSFCFFAAEVDPPPSFKQMLLRLTQVLTNRLVNQIALLKVMYTLNMKQGNRPFSI